MEPYKKRLHLDRGEVLILLGLVVLLTGLTFTLGVMVGYGIHPMGSEEVALSKSTHDALGTESSERGESDSETSRKPASVSKGSEAGAELKKAFYESKQKALVDMTLRNTGPQQPKSILDAEAHFEAHPWNNREPAGNVDDSNSSADMSGTPGSSPSKGKAKEKESGVPSPVKSLFERAPTSIDRFAPASGSYTVQIASFPAEDESNAKVAELRKLGFNQAYVEKTTWNGETWYRVGVGSFPSGDWARKAGEKLVRRHLANDFVVHQVN